MHLRTRSSRNDDLRAQILHAALRLFNRKGFHATSVQDIVGEASCSKGAFYHHFQSKEDLLLVFHETFIQYELEQAEQALQGEGGPLDKLRKIAVQLIDSIARFRPYVGVFIQERRFLSHEGFAIVKAKRDRYEGIVRGLVEEAIGQGQLRPDLDPQLFTLAFFGMYNWSYHWFQPNKPLSTEEVAGRLFDFLIDGARSRAAEGGPERPGRKRRRRPGGPEII
ncbi:MAG: TetR/AcrR family transcriptional regulator [Bacillota bacterium]